MQKLENKVSKKNMNIKRTRLAHKTDQARRLAQLSEQT